MARSLLTNTTNDLISDSGAVLWSIVKGEQLEFPVTLNFLKDATVKPSNNYQYEAVVIEAENFEGQSSRPSSVRINGAQTKLTVRAPLFIGDWSENLAANKEDVTKYNNKFYKLISGAGYVNAITPDMDPLWSETAANKIYIQFPQNLGEDWQVKASVDSPVYGFFELRVTEPSDPIFSRTWKPVRGMVQILFSPTDSVID